MNIDAIFSESEEEKLKTKIMTQLIEPAYYNDTEKNIRAREKWKSISDISQTISKILAGLSTVLAFAAGFFNITILSFIAGCLGTLSLVTQQFSQYSLNESKDRTLRINRILTNLHYPRKIDKELSINS